MLVISHATANPIHDIFVSPFSEPSSHAELNNFLKSHRIINVEKRLIDGERGTGWVFLVEYSDIDGSKAGYTMSSKIDWRDVLTPSQFAVYDLLRKRRKEISDKTRIPLYGILSNEQLALMSQNLPKTKEDFLKIKGINESKYKQWGEVFLKAIESALLSAEESEKAEKQNPTESANSENKKENSAEIQTQLEIF